MASEQIIKITQISLNKKNQGYYKLHYRNKDYFYSSDNRIRILNKILNRAHFNETFDIRADEQSQQELSAFKIDLNNLRQEPEYRDLNLKIHDLATPPETEEIKQRSLEKQNTIIHKAQESIQSVYRSSWSWLLASDRTNKSETNQDVVNDLRDIKNDLRASQYGGGLCSLVGITGLLIIAGVLIAGGPTLPLGLIVMASVIALGGLGILSSASACGIKTGVFKNNQLCKKLSSEFLKEPLKSSPLLQGVKGVPPTTVPTSEPQHNPSPEPTPSSHTSTKKTSIPKPKV